MDSSLSNLKVGDALPAFSTEPISRWNLAMYLGASGDHNPIHVDIDFARKAGLPDVIAHGMYTGGLVSAALAMELPGPGTVYIGQELRFERPVRIGDTLTVELTVAELLPERKFVKILTAVLNQSGKPVLSGMATVMAPTQKLCIPRPPLPRITVT